MTDCNHDCSNCSSDCGERVQSFLKPLNARSKVKKVVGVVSGKGGVGKSLVTSLLAVYMQREKYVTAVLDADITGPSIPQTFGIKEKATGDGELLFPAISSNGTQIMSINLLLENESDPVVWRGPVIAGAVSQFWTDVVWQDVDFMFVDMPPGTGDVPLTVFQSLPVDGIVVVASPQELVGKIVEKAVKMARMLNIPIVGVVENMSYYVCPDCKKRHEIFGKSNVSAIAEKYGINAVSRLPIDPNFAALCDKGEIEKVSDNYLREIVEKVKSL